MGDTLVLLHGSTLPEDINQEAFDLTITAFNIKTFEVEYEKKYAGYKSKVGSFKRDGSKLIALVAGTDKTSSLSTKLMYVVIDYD